MISRLKCRMCQKIEILWQFDTTFIKSSVCVLMIIKPSSIHKLCLFFGAFFFFTFFTLTNSNIGGKKISCLKKSTCERKLQVS